MRFFKGLIMAMFLLFPGLLAAEPDTAAIIAECEACHGPGGQSAEEDVPGLAGMQESELVAAIEEFYFYERHCTTTTYRSGDRPKTPMTMCNVANTLSEDDRNAIAAYFAGNN